MVPRSSAQRSQLEAIGFWFNEAAPSSYPKPQLLVRTWNARQRRAVAAYLRGGSVFETYRAYSHCRFACGTKMRAMGCRDLADLRFVWPEGLAHYVEVHGVDLPDHFVTHVLATKTPPLIDWKARAREGLISDQAWIAWGIARGAGTRIKPAWLR